MLLLIKTYKKGRLNSKKCPENFIASKIIIEQIFGENQTALGILSTPLKRKLDAKIIEN